MQAAFLVQTMQSTNIHHEIFVLLGGLIVPI